LVPIEVDSLFGIKERLGEVGLRALERLQSSLALGKAEPSVKRRAEDAVPSELSTDRGQ
jgi:hypothetical protein